MPTEPQPLTLAEAVHRAVEVCEDSQSDSLDELLERFEDADEPITGVDDLEGRLDLAIGPVELDAAHGDAAVAMARAVVLYLAHRRDEVDADPVELLRLAARAEFHGQPPDYVGRWLGDQGVEV